MKRRHKKIGKKVSILMIVTILISYLLMPIVYAVGLEERFTASESMIGNKSELIDSSIDNSDQEDISKEGTINSSESMEAEKENDRPVTTDSSILGNEVNSPSEETNINEILEPNFQDSEIDPSSKDTNKNENLESNLQVSNFIDRSVYPEFSASADNTTNLIYSEPGISVYINSQETAMRIEFDSTKIGVNKTFWHGLIPDKYKDNNSLYGESLKKSFEKITFNGSIMNNQYTQNRLFINMRIVQGDLDYIPNYLISIRVPGDVSDNPINAPKLFLKEVNFPEAKGIGINAFMNIYSSLTKVNLPKLEQFEKGNFVSDIRFNDSALTDTPLYLPSLTTMPSGGFGFIMTSFKTILTPKLENIPSRFVTKNTKVIDISGAKKIDSKAFTEGNSFGYTQIDTLWFNNNPEDIQFANDLFKYYNMSGSPIDISILTKATVYSEFGDAKTIKVNDSLNNAMKNKNNNTDFSGSSSYSIQRYSVQQSPSTTFYSFPEKLSVVDKVATSGTVSDKKSHNLNAKWYLDGQLLSSDLVLETKILPTGIHQLEGVIELVSNKTGSKGYISTGIINYDLPIKKTKVWGDVPYDFEENTGILTFTEGGSAFSGYKESPWNRNDEFKVDKEKIKKIVITSNVKTPTDSTRLFSEDTDPLPNLEEIEGLTNLDTSQTTKMDYMFNSLRKLKDLDVSSFDTSKVTSMRYMFQFSIIKSLDLSKWDTQNVIFMTGMLSNLDLLSELKLGTNTKLNSDTGLPNAPTTTEFTGKWTNISELWFGNANELFTRSQVGEADTYKWQNTKPVDPTDPTKPVDPTYPTNPNSGELTIAYASNLNFGTQTKVETTWNAMADVWKVPTEDDKTEEGVPMVSIRDLRGSDKKGWLLTVKQDNEFTDSEGNSLKGAELTFKNLFFAQEKGAPTAISSELVLNNSAQEIASADATTKVGKWSLGLGQLIGKEGNKKTDGILLSVPTKTAKNIATYKTTLTYELTADPTI